MILADKIINLRKKYNWSQEDLAEKMDVSRQSVSKWESANSIPDLNKILKMAELFGVSTDYLLKDEIEEVEHVQVDKEPGIVKVSLEEALNYVETKVKRAKTTALGVFITISSVVPLFALLGLTRVDSWDLSANKATALGLVLLFFMVGIGVTFFIRASQDNDDLLKYEDGDIDLVYGVRSILKDKQKKYRGTYTAFVSLGVMLVLLSVAPLIWVAILSPRSSHIFTMLVLMILMVASGVFLLIPPSTRYTAYNLLIGEGEYAPQRKEATKRIEKIGGVYWPLVTAIYIGWSLWTMAWGITWIVWPVAGIAFAAIVGLANLFAKD